MNILSKKNYLLFDGAMGTYYSSKYDNNIACEYANIDDSDAIYKIHREYIEAGAKAIKTNTFGANRYTLGCDQDKVNEIIYKGLELANQASEGTDVLIFADIGPIPEVEEDNIKEDYVQLIDTFIKYGARNFLFETFVNFEILLELAAYIRIKAPDAIIITSFAVYPDGYSREGLFYIDIINKMSLSGLVDAFGFNCICGPAHMYRLMKDVDINGKNIIIMPNSGYPSSERGRALYVDNSEYFAEKILELKNIGIRILGGCCGTTPRHIAAIAKILENQKQDDKETIDSAVTGVSQPSYENILDKLTNTKKPILVEIDPPFDTDWSYMLRDALLLKQAGADLVTIADSPLAKARADSSILAAKIQREAGIYAMPHITCRDKNLLGIKATLLGLHIEGIRNVLVITGDPITVGERNSVKGVYSLNSYNLANYISSLNSNVFSREEFKIAGALNVNARNFDAELKRANTKIENGISCFLTQAIYTDKAINNLIKATETLKVPIFAGIMPLVSYRNAQFINNEVPGIEIDIKTIEMFKDKSREEAEAIGVNISLDIIARIYSHVSGFYFMTPLKRTNVICELIAHMGKK